MARHGSLSCLVVLVLSLLQHSTRAVLLPSVKPTGSTPLVRWASHPLVPNQTALLHGSFLRSVSTWSVCTSAGLENEARSDGGSTSCVDVVPAQLSDLESKVTLPSTFANDVFQVRGCAAGQEHHYGSGGASCPVLATLNEPVVWWTQGDAGDSGSPGGWVALFGRSLAYGSDAECVRSQTPSNTTGARVRLTRLGDVTCQRGHCRTDPLILPVYDATCFSLRVRLPATIPPGSYSVAIDSGLPATRAFWALRPAASGIDATVRVVPAWTWPSKKFDVDAEYDGNISKALAAAAASGGGEVVLGAREYQMADRAELELADGVTLSGRGALSTRLVWASNAGMSCLHQVLAVPRRCPDNTCSGLPNLPFQMCLPTR